MRNKKLIFRKKEKLKYGSLTFVKDECDKWRNFILKILSMIPEVWSKTESDSLIQTLNSSYQGILSSEEVKDNKIASVPNEIYGKWFKMISIPPQLLGTIKDFEEKIKKNSKIVETWIKV